MEMILVETIIACCLFMMIYFIKMLMFNGEFSMDIIFYTTCIFGLWYGLSISITNYIVGTTISHNLDNKYNYD